MNRFRWSRRRPPYSGRARKALLRLEQLEDRSLLSATGFALTPLVQVSDASPFDATFDAGQSGKVFPNSEVEPQVAVDPNNPMHVVGVWQQDRWSNGGSRGLVAGVSTD